MLTWKKVEILTRVKKRKGHLGFVKLKFAIPIEYIDIFLNLHKG